MPRLQRSHRLRILPGWITRSIRNGTKTIRISRQNPPPTSMTNKMTMPIRTTITNMMTIPVASSLVSLMVFPLLASVIFWWRQVRHHRSLYFAIWVSCYPKLFDLNILQSGSWVVRHFETGFLLLMAKNRVHRCWFPYRRFSIYGAISGVSPLSGSLSPRSFMI